MSIHEPLPLASDDRARDEHYQSVLTGIAAVLEDERDPVAVMATVACELHHAFAYFDWTGFYRRVAPELLKVGPYQGGHGCLSIEYSRGVCGAAARTRETLLVPDVEAFPGHIPCSSGTRSEIVVPVLHAGETVAVLDVDSDAPAAFRDVDRRHLEALCARLAPILG